MITNVIFCNVKDLEELTGLTHKELWEHGFNLDDCDGIAVFDEKDLPLEEAEEYMCSLNWKEWRPVQNLWELCLEGKVDDTIYYLIADWEDYCAGAHYVKYNGKVYMSKHHA